MRSLSLMICFLCTAFGHAQLVINEVCSRNHLVLEDAFGDHPDWIELQNTGDQPIDISGHFLSDRFDHPTKFQLPSIEIPAGGLVIFFSGENSLGDHYFDFGISGEGGSIFLSDPGEVI